MEPKYPQVVVQLIGRDGNAFFILSRTKKAMRRAKISEEEIKKYVDEATSGDYDNLLETTMRWVTTE